MLMDIGNIDLCWQQNKNTAITDNYADVLLTLENKMIFIFYTTGSKLIRQED